MDVRYASERENRFRYGILWNDECVRDGDCPAIGVSIYQMMGYRVSFALALDVFRLYHFDYFNLFLIRGAKGSRQGKK